MSQSVPAEQLAHWLDHYGKCSRDNGKQNDCYWGKDATGRDNGCLRTGWKGRACAHWTPISETELVWLIAAHSPQNLFNEPATSDEEIALNYLKFFFIKQGGNGRKRG